MDDFIASIDKRRFRSNVIGYLVVLLLFTIGPPIDGFLGQAVWAYVWFYPFYYIGGLIFSYQRKQGGGE